MREQSTEEIYLENDYMNYDRWRWGEDKTQNVINFITFYEVRKIKCHDVNNVQMKEWQWIHFQALSFREDFSGPFVA